MIWINDRWAHEKAFSGPADLPVSEPFQGMGCSRTVVVAPFSSGIIAVSLRENCGDWAAVVVFHSPARIERNPQRRASSSRQVAANASSLRPILTGVAATPTFP